MDPLALKTFGVLGRLTEVAMKRGLKSGIYSTGGNTKCVEGVHAANILDPFDGLKRYFEYEKVGSLMQNLSTTTYENIFAETYADAIPRVLEGGEILGKKLETANVTNTFVDENDKSSLAASFEQVARVIDARRALGNVQRDVFFVAINGWDMHNEVTESLTLKLDEVDKALEVFVKEMKDKSMWKDVVLASMSEFGRTITSNGLGTDHGWGGNHFVIGGAVRANVFGEYPTDFSSNSEYNTGRGRMLPTQGWESMWSPLTEWFLDEGKKMKKADIAELEKDILYVVPNKNNFPNLVKKNEIMRDL